MTAEFVPPNVLTIYSRDESEVIALFNYNGTNTVMTSCVAAMYQIFSGLLSTGITYITDGSTRPIQTHTPSTDPHFILKLAEYCRTNYEFIVKPSGGSL